MRIAVFSTKPYDRDYLDAANREHEFHYFENRLNADCAAFVEGFDAVCVFVHDSVNRQVLEACRRGGVKLIALRCAGYNNVDLQAARDLGIQVASVPAYSPHAVAEFAVGLLLTLNRKYHRAYNRIRERNFSLHGLAGFDVRERTVGVVGTGKIGASFAQIMLGFGCKVLAFDLHESADLKALGVAYVPQNQLFAEADIISLHCPLLPSTQHLIRVETLAGMKRGVMLLNTSRGGLIRTADLIDALKSGQVGSVGLDVYEEEYGVFYEDLSGRILADDDLNLLLAYPNVLITSHQGFFTEEALTEIATQTIRNLDECARGDSLTNVVTVE